MPCRWSPCSRIAGEGGSPSQVCSSDKPHLVDSPATVPRARATRAACFLPAPPSCLPCRRSESSKTNLSSHRRRAGGPRFSSVRGWPCSTGGPGGAGVHRRQASCRLGLAGRAFARGSRAGDPAFAPAASSEWTSTIAPFLAQSSLQARLGRLPLKGSAPLDDPHRLSLPSPADTLQLARLPALAP
jgi:hypothetical protein